MAVVGLSAFGLLTTAAEGVAPLADGTGFSIVAAVEQGRQ